MLTRVTISPTADYEDGMERTGESRVSIAGRALASNFDADLDRLADLAGIQPIWWDVDGGYHKVGADTKRTLLAAMRLPAATHGETIDSLSRITIEPALPPAVTAWTQASIPIRLGQPRPAWVTLLREDGSLERFQAQGDYVVLPPQPIGRHRLLNEDRPERFCHLTVAPRACYLPPATVSRRAPLRHCGASVCPAIARRPGHRRLYHARPLRRGSRARRRLHGRPESAACAVPARPKPSEPVSTIGQALPGSDLYRRLRFPRRRRASLATRAGRLSGRMGT